MAWPAGSEVYGFTQFRYIDSQNWFAMTPEQLLQLIPILDPPFVIARYLPAELQPPKPGPSGGSNQLPTKSYAVTTDDQRFALIEKVVSGELTMRQVRLPLELSRPRLIVTSATRLPRPF